MDQGASTITQNQIKQITDAYVFGYPLVLMDVTRQVMTAVSRPSGQGAPINQFHHVPEFPDDTFTDVVSPNADTLYSTAWLDLSSEPIVFSVPDTAGRFYVMQMLDAWTNVFASPGKRTTGTGKANFAITGPDWQGQLPDGVQKLRSPTNMVWIIGRTQTNGKADYDAVHEIQRQYKLTPLSMLGMKYSPPSDVPVDPEADPRTSPLQQVADMTGVEFFTRMCRLMKGNPPAPADASNIKGFTDIGIVPGQDFDSRKLDPEILQMLDQTVKEANAKIGAEAQSSRGELVNGWLIQVEGMGTYGTDYKQRAIVAWVGLGANIPQDAVYPMCRVDSEGSPLSGTNRYRIHFDKDHIPPANAFWSLTMYNSRQAFVKNPINRYAIGDRDKLTFNDDGSLDIYIQHESPGAGRESNWLPAPADDFNIIMRLYWPKQEVLDGTWRPPVIQHVD